MKHHIRIARATDDINALINFYVNGLEFKVIGLFNNHDGFDGIMLAKPGCDYHLEFTHKIGHTVGRASTQDNLLVFYIPDKNDWMDAIQKMLDAGYSPVQSFNPYWDRLGKTFEDSDGYRVVLQQAENVHYV